MESIIIDGKRYRLVPVGPFEKNELGLELSTTAAEEKADLYRSKYDDYKNIPRQELINRIIKVDQMSELDYCLYNIDIWTNWEKLYNAVKIQINCPYKSLEEFRQKGLSLVKEVFERKVSILTGYFGVRYFENEDDYPEITLSVEIYGAAHSIDDPERDYLTPEDD